MGTIVVGIDSSETAGEAAKSAAELAAALGKSLTLVIAHAASKTVFVDGPGGDAWDASLTDGAQEVADQLAISLRDVVQDIEVVAVVGKPADVLVSEAKRLDADIIVVGNRRVQGPGRILGAIATAVTHHAPCDVYITKTT